MNGSEGDSEQKKWGQKRQQFDAVVSTARFNGAVDGLIQGTIEVQSLIALLDELNNVQSQRGRYMAEILALKAESRRLLTVPFNERVAEFLIEGARRIPWLSDGLASQFAVALGSAADNPQYLDTVNTAVSNLLLDVTRPLKPDTRNYLRALTDKMLASRRLQEARGHLAIVPSVYPSAIPQHLANAGDPASSPTPERIPVSTPGIYEVPVTPAAQLAERASAATLHDGSAPTTLKLGAAEPREQASSGSERKLETAGAVYPRVPTKQHVEPGATPLPTVQGDQPGVHAAPSASIATPELHLPAGKTAPGIGSSASVARDVSAKRPSPGTSPEVETGAQAIERGAPAAGFGAVPAVKHVAPDATGTGDDDWADLDQEELEADPLKQRRRRAIPIWILVVAAGALVAAGVGVWLLKRDGATDSVSPNADSASPAGSAAPAIQARDKKAMSVPSAKAPTTPTPLPAAPTPPPPPPAATLTPPPPPPAATPTPPPPAAKPVAPTPVVPKAATLGTTRITPAPIVRTPPASRPVKPQPPVAPIQPQKPAKPAQPEPKASAEPPSEPAVPTPRTPTPSRTIDDIIVELLHVPNDTASIEAKAHDVARVVARSSRNDAEIILRRLIPEEVLAGTETVDTRALEPVREVVALLLKKVALDKDDNRAALAIDSLGEWAKMRKHGAAAKLTLDQLAEERVVLSRPKRLHALERVQARLGISNAGE